MPSAPGDLPGPSRSGARLRQFAQDQRRAAHVGFWWGFAEGVFFFIVPDVYISFSVLFSRRAGGVAWMASIAGSVLGVTTVYLLITVLGVDYLSFLDRIPGISPGLIQRASQSLGPDHLPYTPLLILAGVPLKLYAALAFSLGHGLGPVLLWTVFARLVRIGPVYAGFALLQAIARGRIGRHPAAWCVALGIFWMAFYTFYFIHMSRV